MPTKRRIRIKRNPYGTVTPAKKLADIKEKAKDIEAKVAEVMELNEEIRGLEAQILEFMTTYQVNVVEGTYGDFLHDVPKGKSVTVVDINELKDRMTEEDFLTVLKPQITEVKKHFSPKEFADISTTTPGKAGEPRVKYKPHKK